MSMWSMSESVQKNFYKKLEKFNKRIVFEIAATNTKQYTLLDR